MVIEEIADAKERYINLLLIGDEQENMINRYLSRGKMFIGKVNGKAVATIVVLEKDKGVIEIKNLAVLPEYQKHGYGRQMLQYAESLFRGHTIILGTGETPSTLRFYQKCGYQISGRIPNFFTDNYDHPIIEEGIRLRDMLILQKKTINKNE